MALAEQCGIDALVEVHDTNEAKRAVDAVRDSSASTSGTCTLSTSIPHTPMKVVDALPRDAITVCESGMLERRRRRTRGAGGLRRRAGG